MFKKKYMKKLTALFFGVLISGSILAQTEKSAADRAKVQTEKMSEELKLTEDQKSKIYEINLGINQKIDGLKTSGLSEEEKKKAMHHNNEARKEMIKAILTKEQNEILEKKMAERKEMRQQIRKEVRKEIKESDKKKSE
jgi:hypothetical protein